MVDIVSFINSN